MEEKEINCKIWALRKKIRILEDLKDKFIPSKNNGDFFRSQLNSE